MNIFILDENPVIAAQQHCDKHVVKMIVELAQLLSTAHRVLDGIEAEVTKVNLKTNKSRTRKIYVMLEPYKDSLLYRTTHVNHPCAIWVRESYENYMWTWQMLVALLDEYWYRYGQKKGTHHKVRTSGLEQVLCVAPMNLPKAERTPFAQAMPEEYRNADAVEAYRAYYRGPKANLLKYTTRERPAWL